MNNFFSMRTVFVIGIILITNGAALLSEEPHLESRVKLENDTVVSISHEPKGLLVLGKSGNIYLYDRTGLQISKYKTDAVFCEYSSENKALITISNNGIVERIADGGDEVWRMQLPSFSDVVKPALYPNGILVALNLNKLRFIGMNGSILWENGIPDARTAARTLLEKREMVVSYSDGLMCFDDTGSVKWKAKNEAWVSSPNVSSAGIFAGDSEGWAHFYSSLGIEQWKVKLGGFLKAGGMAVNPQLLFICATDGKIYCLDTNGNVQWHRDLGEHIWNSLSYIQGRLLIGDIAGNLSAFDPNTGKLLWIFDTRMHGSIREPAIQVSESLFAFVCSGEIFLLELPEK